MTYRFWAHRPNACDSFTYIKLSVIVSNFIEIREQLSQDSHTYTVVIWSSRPSQFSQVNPAHLITQRMVKIIKNQASTMGNVFSRTKKNPPTKENETNQPSKRPKINNTQEGQAQGVRLKTNTQSQAQGGPSQNILPSQPQGGPSQTRPPSQPQAIPLSPRYPITVWMANMEPEVPPKQEESAEEAGNRLTSRDGPCEGIVSLMLEDNREELTTQPIFAEQENWDTQIRKPVDTRTSQGVNSLRYGTPSSSPSIGSTSSENTEPTETEHQHGVQLQFDGDIRMILLPAPLRLKETPSDSLSPMSIWADPDFRRREWEWRMRVWEDNARIGGSQFYIRIPRQHSVPTEKRSAPVSSYSIVTGRFLLSGELQKPVNNRYTEGKRKEKYPESPRPPSRRSPSENSNHRPRPRDERHKIPKPRRPQPAERLSPRGPVVVDDRERPSRKLKPLRTAFGWGASTRERRSGNTRVGEQSSHHQQSDGLRHSGEDQPRQSTESRKRVSISDVDAIREFRPGSAPGGGRSVELPDILMDDNRKTIKESKRAQHRARSRARSRSRSRKPTDDDQGKGKQPDRRPYYGPTQNQRVDGSSSVPSGQYNPGFMRLDGNGGMSKYQPSSSHWNGPDAARQQPHTAEAHRPPERDPHRAQSHQSNHHRRSEHSRHRNHDGNRMRNYSGNADEEKGRDRHHSRSGDRVPDGYRINGEASNSEDDRVNRRGRRR
ncbi:hypothetical protein V8F20_011467 [Naviculisporaceae sp. PSN 640]